MLAGKTWVKWKFCHIWTHHRTQWWIFTVHKRVTSNSHKFQQQWAETRGGGLCVYINIDWCVNTVHVCSFCSPLLEFVTVRGKPFNALWKFTIMLIDKVYNKPSDNLNNVLAELYRAISELQNSHPDGLFLYDKFLHISSQLSLNSINMLTFQRGANVLNWVYTNITGA